MEPISENVSKAQYEEIIRRMIDDPAFRRAVCEESLYWFAQYYFHKPEHAGTPEFHREILNDLQNLKDEVYVIAAGRGMGKSTLANLTYALWCILCKGEKFAVIMSGVQRQSDQLLENVRDELEGNERIIEDFGPVKKSTDKWNRAVLEVGNYDAKIIAGSIDQPIRSMKHRQYRPGLFILDDIEDSASVKSSENRAKLLERYERDIVPAGYEDTKIVILGGILDRNSFVAHMKTMIHEKKIRGIYREYPLLDKDGICLWPERYPDEAAIDKLRRKIGDIAFRQEYLLEVISTDEQVIRPEWLEGQDYDELPNLNDLRRILISVDPAVSKDDRAAYTAIIVLYEFMIQGQQKLYIAAHPVNERLTFHEMQERIKSIYFIHASRGPVKVIVEGIAAQQYISQELKRKGIYVEACAVKGDKRERLAMAGAAVQARAVYFHRAGCETLKTQLIEFDYATYKDLADAFSQGVIELVKTNEPERIISLEEFHYYDADASFSNEARLGNGGIGIHLALTEKDVGKKVALVTGRIIFDLENNHWGKLFIMPNPVNEKMGFQHTLNAAQKICEMHRSRYFCLFTEKMSEDDAPVQALTRVGAYVMPMPGSDDRRANFIIAADYIKDGTILLPNKGCEELIRQMLNYDVESNTELVDAFSYLVLGVIREGMTQPRSPGWSSMYDPPGAGYG
jgi:hypothetical protein